MGATLAHLVVEAIRLGGDTTGIPDDDLAVDVLQQVTLFNSHVCAKLAERLSGPEGVALWRPSGPRRSNGSPPGPW